MAAAPLQCGSVRVGDTATVCDGEIAGMLGETKRFETGEQILLLADSKAAITAVKKAGKRGKARTEDLKKPEDGSSRILGLRGMRKWTR